MLRGLMPDDENSKGYARERARPRGMTAALPPTTAEVALARRVEALERDNSDLTNLLDSSRIATILLDDALRIRSFTPAATEIFRLLKSDIGRPLDAISSDAAYPELRNDVGAVRKSRLPVERRVSDAVAGRHYAVRVLPYRGIDDRVSGSVVIFTDVTAIQAAEAALRESEESYRLLFESIDEGFSVIEVMFDDAERAVDYRFLSTNPAFARHTGLENAVGKTISELVPDLDPHWFEIYGRIALTGQSERFEDEARALGRWYDVFAFRVGEPAQRKVAILFRDVRERKEMEQALREAERRQQLLIEGIPQLVWRAIGRGAWTWASPQWTGYTGQSDSDSHGLGWIDMLHPEDRAVARAAWAAAEEQGGFDVEYRVRNVADGGYRWFRTRATPVRDAGGAIIEWLGTSTDIDDLRRLQTRQELLVAELQHRVRNMLSLVRSVFSRTVETATDFDALGDHFRGRLDALARSQVIVTRSADGVVDLEELIRDELLSVGVGDGPKLSVGGPRVALDSAAAESIGLAIHELTTNAIKYGALKGAEGRVEISWSLNMGERGGRILNLEWLEQGVPMVPLNPTRRGFGRELIEQALPYRLGAQTGLEFQGGGIRCTVVLPMAEGSGEQE